MKPRTRSLLKRQKISTPISSGPSFKVTSQVQKPRTSRWLMTMITSLKVRLFRRNLDTEIKPNIESFISFSHALMPQSLWRTQMRTLRLSIAMEVSLPQLNQSIRQTDKVSTTTMMTPTMRTSKTLTTTKMVKKKSRRVRAR